MYFLFLQGLNRVFDEAVRIVLRKESGAREFKLKKESNTKKCIIV